MDTIQAPGIGKLERIALRDVWDTEPLFTRWLKDNIDVLSSALEINLVSADTEQPTGDFSIDLVAEDDTGGTVIIENQLDKSDHDHLGKLITYLRGIGARVAIWIVADPRPEHVAAITWLNESRSAHFYMVKLEAVKIGGSPPAALLTKIVGPSEETAEVGQTKKDLAEREELRKRWWTQLIDRVKHSANVLKLHEDLTPSEYSWIGAASGVLRLNLNYVVLQTERRVELWIYRGPGSMAENKSIFDQLNRHKDEIEKEFGAPLDWEKLENATASRISCTLHDGGYRSPEDEWAELQKHQIDAMTRLEKALRPYLEQLTLSA